MSKNPFTSIINMLKQNYESSIHQKIDELNKLVVDANNDKLSKQFIEECYKNDFTLVELEQQQVFLNNKNPETCIWFIREFQYADVILFKDIFIGTIYEEEFNDILKQRLDEEKVVLKANNPHLSLDYCERNKLIADLRAHEQVFMNGEYSDRTVDMACVPGVNTKLLQQRILKDGTEGHKLTFLAYVKDSDVELFKDQFTGNNIQEYNEIVAKRNVNKN